MTGAVLRPVKFRLFMSREGVGGKRGHDPFSTSRGEASPIIQSTFLDTSPFPPMGQLLQFLSNTLSRYDTPLSSFSLVLSFYRYIPPSTLFVSLVVHRISRASIIMLDDVDRERECVVSFFLGVCFGSNVCVFLSEAKLLN